MQKGLSGSIQERIKWSNAFRSVAVLDSSWMPRVLKENTDDHPVLEFMLVKDYQMGKMGKDMFVELQTLLNIDPVREKKIGNPDRLVRMSEFFSLSQGRPRYLEKVGTSPSRTLEETLSLRLPWIPG